MFLVIGILSNPPYPVPTNRYAKTVLGILFDRVLLPWLYLLKSIDKKTLQDEFERILFPANAYIVTQKNSLPIFSDRQVFPFPVNVSHNSNANLLTSYLALSSLMLVIPRIKLLNAEQIVKVRTRMKEEILDIHTVYLSMTDKFRELVVENPSLDLALSKGESNVVQTSIIME